MWLQMSNVGSFDFVKACQMIGASVKVTDEPIGLFGSGTKYALAQCLREGVSVRISYGHDIYELVGCSEEFRGRLYQVVGFKNLTTGEVIKTGITSDFGKEDWTETWFILREFYSNMLDETGATSIVATETEIIDASRTYVWLQYSKEIKDIYEQRSTYFVPRSWAIRVLDDPRQRGNFYRRGVYLGEGVTGFDMQSDDFPITESRTVVFSHARGIAGSLIANSSDVAVAKRILDPDYVDEVRNHRSREPMGEIYSSNAISKLLLCYLQETYPNRRYIVTRDSETATNVRRCGHIPVFTADLGIYCDWATSYTDLIEGTKYPLTSAERDKLDAALKKLTLFDFPEVTFYKTSPESCAMGTAHIAEKYICLHPNVLEGSEVGLLDVLIHEFGHIVTAAGDYDQAFVNYFTKKLAELCM